MAKARLEVELATFSLGDRLIRTKLLAQSDMDPRLIVVAYNSEADSAVVARYLHWPTIGSTGVLTDKDKWAQIRRRLSGKVELQRARLP